MKRIFISHSYHDSEIAVNLKTDLEYVGADVIVDVEHLKPGDDIVSFMNCALNKAEIILILFSKNSPSALWQIEEINAALWEAQKKKKQIVVVKTDDTPLPPLLSKNLYLKLETKKDYIKVAKEIAKVATKLEEKNPFSVSNSLVEKAIQSSGSNPFRRVRAEFFEDFPEELAKSFSEPDAEKVRSFHEFIPSLVEGARGTGKSMLLMSLRARNLAERSKLNRTDLSLNSAFGFYLKFNRGVFSEMGDANSFDNDPELKSGRTISQAASIFKTEFSLYMLVSFLDELEYCRENEYLDISKKEIGTFFNLITFYLCNPSVSCGSLMDIKKSVTDLQMTLKRFACKAFIWDIDVQPPDIRLDLDDFKGILNAAKQSFSCLREARFIVLLDEHENLFPFQKKVVNTFVKLGAPEFVAKVARKQTLDGSMPTEVDQELQELHDYERIVLSYDVSGSSLRDFSNLLKNIVKNSLFVAELSDPATFDINIFLPEEDADLAKVETCFFELIGETKASYHTLSDQRKEYLKSQYWSAAKLKACFKYGGKSEAHVYSGLDRLALLSSGIIRTFLKIAAVGFLIEKEEAVAEANITKIKPENQAKAVRIVSEHFYATVSQNVVNYGHPLKYFLTDISDIFREKFDKHKSEPEAARIRIDDHHQLFQTEKYVDLKQLISAGIKEGVFQLKGGRPSYKGKQKESTQALDLIPNRIFSPIFRLSPRARWFTPFSVKELDQLRNPKTRRSAKNDKMKKIIKDQKVKDDENGDKLGLFDGH